MPDFGPSDAGRRIGRYRLVYPVGEGGMSIVYLAQDEVLERPVAVKVLHRHLSRDPEARARFAREARAVARLTHRNIPEIYDFSGQAGEPGVEPRPADGPAYIVTEFVDGAPLSRLMREGPALLPELGVMMTLGVARALAHAHSQAIVHRDVKPENVLVGKDGIVRLTDFGIAQVRGLESMTMTGTLIGSPAHMAPEQIELAKDVDQRADVWGLGTVLYMVSTGGQLPFEADNPHRLLRKIVEGHYLDPRRISPHVDSQLAAIIRQCLTVDRDKRYQTAEAVAVDLERWLGLRGLDRPEVEIRDYLADPEGASLLLSKRLAQVLLGLGDAALSARNRSLALEHFGRVLILEPDDATAMTRVRKLEKQLRTWRGARVVMLFALAAAVLVGLVWLALRPGVEPVARRLVPGLSPLPAPPSSPPRVTPTAAKAPVAPTLVPTTAGAVFGDVLGFELARVDGRLGRADGAPGDPRPDRADRGDRGDRVGPNGQNGTNGGGSRPPNDAKQPVAVRLSAYPPAVLISVDGRTLTRGEVVELVPGRHRVTLSHPGCASCAPVDHVITVPPGAPYTQAFTYEPTAASLTPASLLVRCADGGYVIDEAGQRFGCNVRHDLPVKSLEPRFITLTAFSPDGKKLKQQRFRVGPSLSIVWSP